MPKYEVIRSESERFEDNTLRLIVFEAVDDLQALLQVADHCEMSYMDEDWNEWYEDDFKKPSMNELINWLESENGDSGIYIYVVRREDNKKIIFKSDNFKAEEWW